MQFNTKFDILPYPFIWMRDDWVPLYRVYLSAQQMAISHETFCLQLNEKKNDTHQKWKKLRKIEHKLK